ncbi:hypothetical protein [Pseudomonas vanderleydeniana]|uniref:Uncharacterized protein n=1 Tax=Pseudomonas vanderleydeniana TaxID=2745495 RepID=A0A9E6PGI0_9PSED|nr:hypothetical protein [Pseudomonas vanderleydeniana]QXI25636.1 hypothetical protein HU752_016785 [Pseudomonas vanderleydeniana]
MNYHPLSPTVTERHVLFIDSLAPSGNLHAYANERLQAGRDMVDSLSCLNLNKIDDEDLAHFIQGAALLLRDGFDIWKVIETRALQAQGDTAHPAEH